MKNENFDLKVGLKKYIVGYILSIVLTVFSFLAATGLTTGKLAVQVILSILACAQVLVQLFYFMHVNDEEKPRYILWNLIFFVIILAIIALGTIFIMYQLQYTH